MTLAVIALLVACHAPDDSDTDVAAAPTWTGTVFTGSVDDGNIVGFCNGHDAAEIDGDVFLQPVRFCLGSGECQPDSGPYSGVGTYTDLRDLSCVTAIHGRLDIGMPDDAPFHDLSGLDRLEIVDRDVTIAGDTLTSLHGLERLRSAQSVSISHAGVMTLDGLDALATAKDLMLEDLNGLTSLHGLGSLSTLPGRFWVSGAPALTTLRGVGPVTEVGDLWINGARSLTDLGGLEGVTAVHGDLLLRGLSMPTLAGLEHLTAIDGALNLEGVETDRSSFTSLAGLDALASVGSLRLRYGRLTSLTGAPRLAGPIAGEVTIDFQRSLVDFHGLEGITEIDGTVDLSNNPVLTSLDGLDGLTAVGAKLVVDIDPALVSLQGLRHLTETGGLELWRNDALPSLDGLDALMTVRRGSGLMISTQGSLTSLRGLGGLRTIEGPLTIDENHALIDVTALYDLDSVTGTFAVTHNGALGDAAANALVAEVPHIGGPIYVSN